MIRPLAVPALLLSLAASAEPFTAEHLVRIDRVGGPVVSPDGTQVVYTLRSTDMDVDRGRTDLWLSSLDGGEPQRLTTHDAGESSPAWAPDGRHILFLSKRGDHNQVWRIAVDGGEAQPVTDLPLDVGSFRLSPGGDRLVVSLSIFLDCDTLACTVERNAEASSSKVSAQAYDQLFVRHWDYWLDDRRSQLFALTVGADGATEGKPVRVSRLDADVPSRVWGGSGEYAIANDGETIYFAARLRDAAEPTSTNFDIYAAPMNGDGEVVNLTRENPAWDTAPILSPDGRQLAYLAMARAGFEADQFEVVLRDLESGSTRTLTTDWDRSPSSMAFTADGSSLLLNAQDVGHKTLWQLELDGGEIRRLREDAYISSFDVAGDRVVFARDTLTSPSELFVGSLTGADERQLTRFSERVLDGVELGEYEQFSFAGADGHNVYGFLVKPVGFDANASYPIAFLIHGGPQGSFSNHWHYRWNPQTYAGQGYAVVMIDFHGSTGYGQNFTDAITGDWGGKPLEDLQLGLAAALERYDFLDGDKVCALGASYGGYMINWIAGNWADRFDCLVNHDGIFDMRSMYFTTEELWFVEWESGGPYFSVPQNHERFNPANHVENWRTPMLVIHGELDYRVPVTQGLATFTALQRRGIESRLVYFPDENHWVLRPHNSIRWHEEVNGWLGRFLAD
ncbi:MAG: S9 family peptidase [Pseudomonadota bacterium]